VGLVDFAVSGVALLGLMAYYHVAPTMQLLWLPVFLAGGILAATGVGTLLSALTVSYRDFRYVVPFLMQLWMFITPVMYPSSLLPAGWRGLAFLNPMTGVVEGFRACFLNQRANPGEIALSLVMALFLACAGVAYFRTVERRFADII
jgi:lipopolysaccharide transport system permease protein